MPSLSSICGAWNLGEDLPAPCTLFVDCVSIRRPRSFLLGNSFFKVQLAKYGQLAYRSKSVHGRLHDSLQWSLGFVACDQVSIALQGAIMANSDLPDMSFLQQPGVISLT